MPFSLVQLFTYTYIKTLLQKVDRLHKYYRLLLYHISFVHFFSEREGMREIEKEREKEREREIERERERARE